jgi:hypothetical protein
MSADAGDPRDPPPEQPLEDSAPEPDSDDPPPEHPPDDTTSESVPDELPPEESPEEPAPEPRPWDDIEVPELEEAAAARAATESVYPEASRPRRRRSRLGLLAGLLILAAIGFLIWYFLFRSEDESGGSSEAAAATVAPVSLDFGDQDVGKRSPPQTVTLTNTGARPIGIESIELNGPNRKSFTIAKATTCGPVAPLNEDESCTIAIRFRPTGRGDRTAALVVRVSGVAQPLRVALTGAGVGEPEVALEATRIDLGEIALGADPSTGQTTLTNRGNVALRIEAIELEGAAAGEFEVLAGKKRCAPSRAVKPKGSCTLVVRFRPSEVGGRTATLVVRHDASDSLSQIQLQGVGVGVARGTVSPDGIAFGGVRVNRRSAPETVTFENTGTAAATISSVSLGGEGARHFRIADTTCTPDAKVRPGATCTVDVRFRPRTRGAHAATLVIEANTPAGEHAVELRGRGTRAGG